MKEMELTATATARCGQELAIPRGPLERPMYGYESQKVMIIEKIH